jgi:hypothetical protein
MMSSCGTAGAASKSVGGRCLTQKENFFFSKSIRQSIFKIEKELNSLGKNRVSQQYP